MAVDKCPVEASHIMMFARSVGDDNQIYYDEDYAKTTEPGSIIAPPTFAQSSAQFDPDYFLRPKIQTSSLMLEYHRHLKPGDVLTATVGPGKTWEKEGKRSGKLVFSETVTEYRDQNGELVITARGVGVRTERPVDQ